jgi:hypothetical protein
MPGISWEAHSPLWDLVPINSIAGPSKGKGRTKEEEATDKGKPEREQLVSLTVSEFEGVFHNGDSCFVYDWINDEHGDSSPEGLKETKWLTNQSYQDASEEPIE